MITLEKIRVYEKFHGDIDGWARIGSQAEKLLLNDNDWHLIEQLIQDLSLIKNGMASDSLVSSINQKLKAACDNEDTIDALRNMS